MPSEKTSTVRYQDTPNPNAIKCVLDRAIPALPGRDGPRSYSSAAAADGDPLALAIFEIKGVVNVLVSDQWITVNRAPGVEWRPIKQALERIVRQLPASPPAGE